MKGELDELHQEDILKSFFEILEISMKNPTVPVSYRTTESDEIY
jgi:hypothetical protein